MLFYKSRDLELSYDELIRILNQTNSFKPDYQANRFVDFALNTLVGVLTNQNFILNDYLFAPPSKLNNESILVEVNVKDLDDLIAQIKSSNAAIGIYSSGSEGAPKLIYQPIARFFRSVRVSEEYTATNWAFTYNPSHSAGIQMMFQALLNQSCLVALHKLKRDTIYELLKMCDYISATPTFYRMLAPYNQRVDGLQSVTLNGEKTTQKLIDDLKSIFPKAKMRNIYGSTEAGPLMSSDSTDFMVPSRLDGKLMIIRGELYFHQSLVSNSVNTKEWYPSGDLVEVIKDLPLTIRFISRKSRILNVAGHNVNPQQVEEYILTHPSVLEAQVLSKEHKLIGNLLTAHVKLIPHQTISEKDLLSYLKEVLPAYKIPRIIKFTDDISVGRTGKKSI